MRNLQKTLNIIWQLPISWRRPPPPPFSSKNLQTTSFPPILDKLSTPTIWNIWGGFTLCMVPIGTLPPLLLPLLKKKKLYGPYYINNMRRKFSFYQKKSPWLHATHLVDLRKLKSWVDLGDTQCFSTNVLQP